MWQIEQSQDRWVLIKRTDGGSHSTSYRSCEDAQKEYDRWLANGRCRECGDVLDDHWEPKTKARVLAEQVCHGCLFWQDRASKAANPRSAIIGEQAYWIDDDAPAGYRGFVGHGGAEFVIRFNDGRTVVSHNLWANGRVPEWFRDRLPSNAIFEQRGHRAIGPFAGYGGSGSADAACQ